MTSTSPRTSNRPSHRVYAVTRKDPNAKGRWQEIGAAWPHKDGKGLRLKLDYLPLNGAEILLREPDPAETAEADLANTAE